MKVYYCRAITSTQNFYFIYNVVLLEFRFIFYPLILNFEQIILKYFSIFLMYGIYMLVQIVLPCKFSITFITDIFKMF